VPFDAIDGADLFKELKSRTYQRPHIDQRQVQQYPVPLGDTPYHEHILFVQRPIEARSVWCAVQ